MKASRWVVNGMVFAFVVALAAVVPVHAQEAAAGAAKADLVPLKLELPKPMFIGTPKNIVSPNLERAGTKREPLMVPKDAANISSKKTVTSSEKEPIIGELSQITDGDKEGADGSFVELGFGTQWVQIDLGEVLQIDAVVVWHYHSQARVYHDVVVQAADDADFIKNVQTLFNNDHDNSSGLGVGKDKEYIETNEGRSMDAKGMKGRYIRLTCNGNTSNDVNDYIEVEVYGRPAK